MMTGMFAFAKGCGHERELSYSVERRELLLPRPITCRGRWGTYSQGNQHCTPTAVTWRGSASLWAEAFDQRGVPFLSLASPTKKKPLLLGCVWLLWLEFVEWRDLLMRFYTVLEGIKSKEDRQEEILWVVTVFFREAGRLGNGLHIQGLWDWLMQIVSWRQTLAFYCWGFSGEPRRWKAIHQKITSIKVLVLA